MRITAIIAAAGKGGRAECENKLFEQAQGKTVLEYAAQNFLDCDKIDDIIIVAANENIDRIKNLFEGKNKPVNVVCGGATRTASVKNALMLANGADIVLIHDGARPFVSEKVIEDCIKNVINFGSGIAAVPVRDTLKKADNGCIAGGIDRENLYAVQTPQGFYYKDISKAYDMAGNKTYTDDSSVYAEFIGTPRLCEGESGNIKITYFDDLKFFYREKSIMKCGTGYDSHRFEKERKFILGGVEIPFEKGLAGHSDADALAHAICDSLLSAAGLSDIGNYFPDSDDKYKNADSMKLLEKCRQLIGEKGYKVCNVSAVINCEKPKISPYISQMKENIALALNIKKCDIGISAKTNEGMGFSGRGEGLFVIANSVII